MKIGVFSSGYNCASYVRQAVESVRAQDFADWVMVVVDDASEDGTFEQIPQDSRIFSRLHLDRRHCCASKQEACSILASMLSAGDILVQLDLDDYLLPGALSAIHAAHESGAWVTYGTWRDEVTGEIPRFPDYSAGIHESIRHRPWVLTAPNTLRVGLWRRIPDEYFRWNATGKLYETGHDGSLMFAAADLAGAERVRRIATPIYAYRRNLDTSVMRTWPIHFREALFAEQRNKPRLDVMEALE